MIPVIELVAELRYELGDMNGVNISDYELIQPVNKAVRLLYGTLSDRYVYTAVKRKPITIGEENSYRLPPDFVRVHQVIADGEYLLKPSSRNIKSKASYRIIDGELYAEEGTYTLEYYYIPAKISGLEDKLDVPESMRVWVEQIALALYKKDGVTASEVAEKCCEILACREISHLEDIGPVQVLGGRT